MKIFLDNICKVLFPILLVVHGSQQILGQNTQDIPAPIVFDDHGDQIQGWLYKAMGYGPFSTVVLLQGSVGQDGDLFRLGENLAKAGFNAMTYNYPGSWRSEGIRTDKSALSSVQSAINFVMSPSISQLYDIDTTDIILIGYSYGGGMALLGAAHDLRIKKVISIAGGDLSIRAKELQESPELRRNFEQNVEYILSVPEMARGSSGKEYVETMIKNRDEYDIKKYAAELAKKKVFLIAGSLDHMVNKESHILPLYRELHSKGACNISIATFETDHSFANSQNELSDAIVEWLNKVENQKLE